MLTATVLVCRDVVCPGSDLQRGGLSLYWSTEMWSVLVLVFRDVVYSVPGIGLRDVVCPFTGLQMCGLHMSCYWSAEMWYIPRNGLQKGSSYWLWYTEVQCTVRKMNSTLLQIELIPKTQTDIARKFKLKALRSEARKFKLCL
jgi:hypothetical protein